MRYQIVVSVPFGLLAVPYVSQIAASLPLGQTAGFAERDAEFEGKDTYADWRFIYRPIVVTGKR